MEKPLTDSKQDVEAAVAVLVGEREVGLRDERAVAVDADQDLGVVDEQLVLLDRLDLLLVDGHGHGGHVRLAAPSPPAAASSLPAGLPCAGSVS